MSSIRRYIQSLFIINSEYIHCDLTPPPRTSSIISNNVSLKGGKSKTNYATPHQGQVLVVDRDKRYVYISTERGVICLPPAGLSGLLRSFYFIYLSPPKTDKNPLYPNHISTVSIAYITITSFSIRWWKNGSIRHTIPVYQCTFNGNYWYSHWSCVQRRCSHHTSV